MRIEDFIRKNCRFAAEWGYEPVRDSKAEWESANKDGFEYPYESDENPYEDLLYKMEVRYNPSTEILTLVPDIGRYDDDDERKKLELQLTPEQARILDYFEDDIFKRHTEHVTDKNDDAFQDWGDHYASQNGFGKSPFVYHDREAKTVAIYPDRHDESATQEWAKTFTEDEIRQNPGTGFNFHQLPARKVWKKPLPPALPKAPNVVPKDTEA
jgi:hypothetical protein